MLMSFHVRGRRSHWLTAALRARRDKKASSHFAITLETRLSLPCRGPRRRRGAPDLGDSATITKYIMMILSLAPRLFRCSLWRERSGVTDYSRSVTGVAMRGEKSPQTPPLPPLSHVERGKFSNEKICGRVFGHENEICNEMNCSLSASAMRGAAARLTPPLSYPTTRLPPAKCASDICHFSLHNYRCKLARLFRHGRRGRRFAPV